ncbi:MAG TPA: FG-GAP repeat protein [Xanthomonadales bacterium]|nr:FG-GAP repeat protein [Xanthomonadales bacterium]
MRFSIRFIVACALAAAATATLAGPPAVELTIAPPGAGSGGDRMGTTVALVGDVALVASPRDSVGSALEQGSVAVYRRIGGSWTQETVLTPAQPFAGARFGYSVAFDGAHAVVGSAQGNAYVYEAASGSWTLEAVLTAPPVPRAQGFGEAVAVAGDLVAVGAPYGVDEASLGGAVYLYAHVGATWTLQERLVPSSPYGFDAFGASIALAGDSLAIGSPRWNGPSGNEQGRAYAFRRIGGAWSQETILQAPDAEFFDRFGEVVALSGDDLVVGAPDKRSNSAYTGGVAYPFHYAGGQWLAEPPLFDATDDSLDRFGAALALSGDLLLLGSPRAGDFDNGAVRVYRRIGPGWTRQPDAALDTLPRDETGTSVAISGTTWLVGAPGMSTNDETYQGGARTYEAAAAATASATLERGKGAGYRDLGKAVALHGDVAALTAPFNVPRVELFVRTNGSWAPAQTIVTPGQTVLDQVNAIAFAGDRLVIGGNNRAHVYVRSGSTWTFLRELQAPSGNSGFGRVVAAADDIVALGTFNSLRIHDLAVGSAQPQQVITTSINGIDAIAVGGERIVAAGLGVVRIHRRDGASWVFEQELTSTTQSGFGAALAVATDVLAIGAPASGAVLVYRRDASGWQLATTLAAPHPRAQQQFGARLAIANGRLVASDDLPDSAVPAVAAWSYDLANLAAAPIALRATTNPATPSFALAADGNRVLLGAPERAGAPPSGNPREGSGFLFDEVMPLFSDGFE